MRTKRKNGRGKITENGDKKDGGNQVPHERDGGMKGRGREEG